ncbi:ABC transporter permease [Pseudonocardia nematodicida]|uniref:ABC transporter permease n=1 Tax=Pseudonocardia nematodicida TaxID=1206997 RepID=A0ABV1K6K2_9PSEU
MSTTPLDAPPASTGTPPRRRRPLGPVENPATRYTFWLLSFAAAIGLWQGVYLLQDQGSLFLAGPVDTLRALIDLIVTGTLWGDLRVTGLELVISFAMAVTGGIVVGILTGYYATAGVLAKPWIAGLYSTPLIALTPLFIMWFGIGIWSKVAVGFIVMIFPILVNTALGVAQANPDHLELMRSMSARPRQIVFKVIVPGAAPHMTTGLRLAIGRGLTALVGAELLGSTAGVGYRILFAAQTFDTATLLANVVVLAVIGAILMNSLDFLDRRVMAYRDAG